MLIPENIIYHNLVNTIALLKEDWETNGDKTKTILYDLFYKDDNGIVMSYNRFDYLKQAEHIFVSSQQVTSSRKLMVTMGYNVQRAALPTVHILLPNENKHDVGIGMGQGYQDDVIVDDKIKTTYTNVSKATYNLMITSDNSSEVVLIYHALKNIMFASFAAYELRGLRDIEFGGQDLQFTNDLVPPEVFHRNLTITFFYESHVRSLNSEDLVKKICFKGTPE